ncbi:unnamed protein product [Closterium sp. Yama58-4]|nr:unnamed protein product [Closterium sp. Yama58-4]
MRLGDALRDAHSVVEPSPVQQPHWHGLSHGQASGWQFQVPHILSKLSRAQYPVEPSAVRCRDTIASFVPPPHVCACGAANSSGRSSSGRCSCAASSISVAPDKRRSLLMLAGQLDLITEEDFNEEIVALEEIKEDISSAGTSGYHSANSNSDNDGLGRGTGADTEAGTATDSGSAAGTTTDSGSDASVPASVGSSFEYAPIAPAAIVRFKNPALVAAALSVVKIMREECLGIPFAEPAPALPAEPAAAGLPLTAHPWVAPSPSHPPIRYSSSAPGYGVPPTPFSEPAGSMRAASPTRTPSLPASHSFPSPYPAGSAAAAAAAAVAAANATPRHFSAAHPGFPALHQPHTPHAPLTPSRSLSSAPAPPSLSTTTPSFNPAHTNWALAETATFAIVNLTLDPINCNIVTDLGAAPILVHILRAAPTAVRDAAIAALFVLSSCDAARLDIGAAGAIPLLVSILLDEKPQRQPSACPANSDRAKEDALLTLLNLSHLASNKSTLLLSGTHRALIHIITRAPGHRLADKALATMRQLVTRPEGREAVVQAEGVGALARALERGSDKGKEEATAILVVLWDNNGGGHRKAIREKKIGKLLTAVARTGSERGRAKALQLLIHLA